MKRALDVVAVILMAVVAGCAIVITSDLHDTSKDLRSTIVNVNGAVTDIRNTTGKLNATLDNVTATTNQLQLAAADQRKYWQQTSMESAKAMRDLRQITARLDRNVNDKLIPHLDAEIGSTALAAQNTFESLQHTADTLTFQLNNPAFSEIADHLNGATDSIESASKSVASGTAHLDQATADIEIAVHRMTRPPSFAKQVGMTLLDVGAKLGNIFSGFIK